MKVYVLALLVLLAVVHAADPTGTTGATGAATGGADTDLSEPEVKAATASSDKPSHEEEKAIKADNDKKWMETEKRVKELKETIAAIKAKSLKHAAEQKTLCTQEHSRLRAVSPNAELIAICNTFGPSGTALWAAGARKYCK